MRHINPTDNEFTNCVATKLALMLDNNLHNINIKILQAISLTALKPVNPNSEVAEDREKMRGQACIIAHTCFPKKGHPVSEEKFDLYIQAIITLKDLGGKEAELILGNAKKDVQTEMLTLSAKGIHTLDGHERIRILIASLTDDTYTNELKIIRSELKSTKNNGQFELHILNNEQNTFVVINAYNPKISHEFLARYFNLLIKKLGLYNAHIFVQKGDEKPLLKGFVKGNALLISPNGTYEAATIAKELKKAA